MIANLTNEDIRNIQNILNQNMKLNAVKFYKDKTGISLKDSVDFIENFNKQNIQPKSSTFPYNTKIKIDNLIRDNKILEAIQLYRNQTGCGLKEAKDYIENLKSGFAKNKFEVNNEVIDTNIELSKTRTVIFATGLILIIITIIVTTQV